MNVNRQIELGILVSPKTKKPLKILAGDWLITEDGQEKYRLLDRQIPILLIDNQAVEKYIEDSPKMVREYAEKTNKQKKEIKSYFLSYRRDYRNPQAKLARNKIFENQNDDSLSISIGGGPTRAHPKLINLNIGPFPNVEIVADAHCLPYRDNSVDALHCEAVLEHLKDPNRAVKEMYRVLKPEGKVFACTPFLQEYHGYPHHYQNFTLTGHQYLFSSNGFKILEAGTCVGPVYTILILIETLIDQYLPSLIAKPTSLAWRLIGRILYPLDRLVNTKENAHILASTTYLLACKPIKVSQ